MSPIFLNCCCRSCLIKDDAIQWTAGAIHRMSGQNVFIKVLHCKAAGIMEITVYHRNFPLSGSFSAPGQSRHAWIEMRARERDTRKLGQPRESEAMDW